MKSDQILLCVHPAGGFCSVFNELARYLKNDVSIVGLQARGLESSQTPFETLSEMIDCYEAAIEDYGEYSVYNIIGYSAGASIAHELACRLEKKGRTIGLVGLLDGSIPSPSYVEQKQSRLDILKELVREFTDSTDKITDYNYLLELVVCLFVEVGYVPEGTPIEFANRMVEEIISFGQRMHGCVLNKGAFDAVYFAADAEEPSQETVDMRQQWRSYCRSVTYVSIKATHVKLLELGPSQAMAVYIQRYLRQ